VLRDPKDGKVERRQFDERTYECMTGRMNWLHEWGTFFLLTKTQAKIQNKYTHIQTFHGSQSNDTWFLSRTISMSIIWMLLYNRLLSFVSKVFLFHFFISSLSLSQVLVSFAINHHPMITRLLSNHPIICLSSLHKIQNTHNNNSCCLQTQ
jgi:hypothetical protein